MFERASAKGITTSFDTGWDLSEDWNREAIEQLLPLTDWFIPSEDELLRIFSAASIDEAIRKLPEERGTIVIKRGSKGALLIKPDGTSMEAEPFPVTVIDTTGAGDSFNAGLIYGGVHGQELAEALRWACACGALATRRIGGAGEVPSPEEVWRFIRSYS